MKTIYLYALWVVLMSIPMEMNAQNYSLDYDMLLQSLPESEDKDISAMIEIWDEFRAMPLDLNNCSSTDLLELGLLSFVQSEQIILYRDELGPFLDVHEVQAIPGIDRDMAWTLSHFVKIKSQGENIPLSKNLLFEGNSELFVRWKNTLEKADAYLSDSIYEGSADALMVKYKYSLDKKLYLGFVAEKDPGESFFRGSNKFGFDHNSAFLHIRNVKKWCPAIILGDFKINTGQGLIAYSGYRLGKSAEVMNVVNSEPSLKRYASLGENGYMRGVGGHFRWRNVDFIPFVSYQKIDAQIKIDSLVDGQVISSIISLPVSGYHRTKSEIDREKSSGKYLFGGAVSIRFGSFKLGLNVLSSVFDDELYPQNKLYNQFSALQRSQGHFSLDYSQIWQKLSFSGEIAIDNNSAIATVNSLQASIARDLDIGLLWRFYPKNYRSILGKGFGESSNNNNEQGLYFGLLLHLTSKWKIKAYLDLWQHRWLKYLVDAPTLGHDLYFRIDFREKRKYAFYAFAKYELKQKNGVASSGKVSPISDLNSIRLRFHASWKINKSIELRNRIEWNKAINRAQSGLLVYQDVIYKPIQFPLSFTGRMAIFDSSTHQTRIYAYENDVLYGSLIPSFNGSGSRFYLNLRYKLNTWMTMEARVARSFYHATESISSGHDQIESNHKTELKCQLRFKF